MVLENVIFCGQTQHRCDFSRQSQNPNFGNRFIAAVMGGRRSNFAGLGCQDAVQVLCRILLDLAGWETQIWDVAGQFCGQNPPKTGPEASRQRFLSLSAAERYHASIFGRFFSIFKRD